MAFPVSCCKSADDKLILGLFNLAIRYWHRIVIVRYSLFLGLALDPEEVGDNDELSHLHEIEDHLAIFCMATYGEGDPTDNAHELKVISFLFSFLVGLSVCLLFFRSVHCLLIHLCSSVCPFLSL